METDSAIAVVGMACRLPGAEDVGRYWAALRAGTEGISHFRLEDLIAAGADPEYVHRADFVPAKGVLPGAHDFDWSHFGYSRAEAARIDPQQRVFLQCAAAAIDDAGIDPARFPGWIGVYAGADKVSVRVADDAGELAQYIGQEKDFVATRVAYKLGLRGPAVTVQTACSTSLTAVHTAARSLRGYECDVALAGGVTVTAKGEWGYLYEPGGILSPDGHCRPFDEHAAGTVPSEGVGVVVLKRMVDALRDGDRIAAVILGSAINNDGAEKIGYTAPSIPGQSDVIRFAQRIAAVDPADIDYVEAHGTATRIGDPVEVQALTDVFREASDATGWCLLGAVKSNVGHTGAAAGVAGFIKTALMLERRELVPTLHYGRPNPLLELDATPFRVSTSTRPWPDRGTPLAAVSSFGVGGTNAHVIVSGPPDRDRPAMRPAPRLLTLSATSPDALGRLRSSVGEALAPQTGLVLPEVARTLADRRTFAHRQAFVAGSETEAADLLRSAPDAPAPGPLDRVGFVFPGQGTLRHPAGAAPYRLLPAFRAYFDEIADALRSRYELDLSPVVTAADHPAQWFSDTVHQQLGLFALGYALGRQLGDWGIRPFAMLGNSIGEYAAAALAGLWTPTDAATLVYQRARAMWGTAPGRMVAVNASAAEVRRRLGSDSGVTIAVVGPDGIVLAGDPAAVEALLAADALAGLDPRPLHTQRAFHSAAMDSALDAVSAAVASTPSRRPRLRLVSNLTGEWADPEAMRTAGYWTGQLRQPVLLSDGMTTLLGSGCRTFLELGPGGSMIAALRQHADWDPAFTTVPLLGRSRDGGERALLRALGTLWERGADLVTADLFAAPRPLRCSLPGHPLTGSDPEFERPTMVWPSAPAQPTASGAPASAATPLTTRAVLAEVWCRALGVPAVADPDDFFGLGGESLTAVNLMSQLRERVGVSVSVTDFTREPTFGALLRLAERGRRGDPGSVPGLVTLAEGGPGRPLFLVADATGITLNYRLLASLLAVDRPVYGLEQVGAGGARSRVEDVAAGHVDAVLRAQPDGPYTIGGWSFGAVVAHEMAHRLAARGAVVDVLLCLDGYVPPAGALPVGFHPGLLSSSLRLQTGALLGFGPVGRQIGRTPELRRRFLTNLRSLLRYRSKPVGCPAVVFAAGVDTRAAGRLRRQLSGQYDGSVQVHPVDGDHWSMLRQPQVRGLAQRLREALLEERGKS